MAPGLVVPGAPAVDPRDMVGMAGATAVPNRSSHMTANCRTNPLEFMTANVNRVFFPATR